MKGNFSGKKLLEEYTAMLRSRAPKSSRDVTRQALLDRMGPPESIDIENFDGEYVLDELSGEDLLKEYARCFTPDPPPSPDPEYDTYEEGVKDEILNRLMRMSKKPGMEVTMPDLIEILEQFNRKERFFLIGRALGNEDFPLSRSFREDLGDEIGIEIPRGAFAAMDYHLDWIAASLWAYQKPDPTSESFPNPDRVVTGTQQDTDLMIAFKSGESYHLILVEAKGYGPWSNKQMSEKAERLEGIFGKDGKKHLEVTPHFCLMSSTMPEKLVTESWPAWMKADAGYPYWMELKLDYPRLVVTRCDSEGTSLIEGDHFCINEVQEPSE